MNIKAQLITRQEVGEYIQRVIDSISRVDTHWQQGRPEDANWELEDFIDDAVYLRYILEKFAIQERQRGD